MRIFLSHSSADVRIAEAMEALLTRIFGEGNVEVVFSSDEREGRGVDLGREWFPWITQQIQEVDKTYVLLTPTSIARPWVMWEAGVAEGVGLGDHREDPVIPITFGLDDRDVPDPFRSIQSARCDTPGGVARLLRDANDDLGDRRIPPEPFSAGLERAVPDFLDAVRTALADAPSARPLLSTMPSQFPAGTLAGMWANCFTFGRRCHAEIAEVVALDDRRVRITTGPIPPRTEAHEPPFSNVIIAEVVNRHLIGQWKNVSDARYFGSLHLAVLTGEKVMEGRYTSFTSDLVVGAGGWKWVHLEPESLRAVEWGGIRLRDPREVHATLDRHGNSRLSLPLTDVVEPRP